MSRARAERLARILWVRALEEEDRDGRFLPFGERRRASRDASGAADPLAARAERLAAAVPRRGWLRLVPRVAAGSLPLGIAVAAGAALGLLVDGLANRRELSLLAFPLLGLVAWNAAIYLAMAARLLAGRGAQARADAVERLLLGLRPRAASDGEGAWIARALARFVALWRTHLARAAGLRLRAALHAGAAAAGSGVIAGMYVRGFAFEYRATWESTFLDAEGVARLLSVVLAPAAFVLGVELPGAEAISAMRAPAGGPAALWIHLWATTALLVVVLPRVLLATAARTRAHGLDGALDLAEDDLYRRRALGSGDEGAVEWAPYAHEPSSAARERIHAALLDLFGARAPIVARRTLRYGDALPEADRPGARPAIVFNLAQTPEREVQGAVLEQIGAAGGIALLDTEPFARVAANAGARLDERLHVWARACAAAGVGAVVVERDRTHDLGSS